ncbi:HPr family phosphocarrier protein [Georgenia sp. M64]|uniref:HPr family phosphocarrier protein n=1 Tax=Georgenia sp. M64 TaxID=3120520 RepID=UPI0030E3E77B
MPSQTAVVGSAVGLHARPAAIIAAAASKYDDEITIAMDGEEAVDAASALMIMTLGAEKGAQVVVESDDETALAEIVALVEQDLDAE